VRRRLSIRYRNAKRYRSKNKPAGNLHTLPLNKGGASIGAGTKRVNEKHAKTRRIGPFPETRCGTVLAENSDRLSSLLVFSGLQAIRREAAPKAPFSGHGQHRKTLRLHGGRQVGRSARTRFCLRLFVVLHTS